MIQTTDYIKGNICAFEKASTAGLVGILYYGTVNHWVSKKISGIPTCKSCTEVEKEKA